MFNIIPKNELEILQEKAKVTFHDFDVTSTVVENERLEWNVRAIQIEPFDSDEDIWLYPAQDGIIWRDRTPNNNDPALCRCVTLNTALMLIGTI